MKVEKANKKVRLEKTNPGHIVAASALIVSIVSIVLQFYFIRGNQLAKANAGNINAQYFLADHYYEVGDYAESIYWFKLASSNKGKIGAKAKNNLAVLYIKTEKDITSDSYLRSRVISLFKEAMTAGVTEAGSNLYLYLHQSPSMLYGDIDINVELKNVEEFLMEKDLTFEDSSSSHATWEYVTTETGDMVPKNTEEYSFVVVNSDYMKDINSAEFKWIFTYKVYEKAENASIQEYAYIPFIE